MTSKKKVLADGMEVSDRLAEKRQDDNEYMRSYSQKMLSRFKNERKVKVLCSKAYAPYFGTTYTALFNTIPVTVKFDGKEHIYPESVARWLQDKFIRVTESNIPKVENDELS